MSIVIVSIISGASLELLASGVRYTGCFPARLRRISSSRRTTSSSRRTISSSRYISSLARYRLLYIASVSTIVARYSFRIRSISIASYA